MTEQNLSRYENDEISLLDILVILAESWKLLVFGPLAAAVLAGALSFLWPKTYESTAILRLAEAEGALLISSPVLDPLIEKFGLLSRFDGIYEDARKYLEKKIVIKFDKKTNLTVITTASDTPEHAQEITNAAISLLLKELLPKGKNKDQIEQKIINNEMVISTNKDALEQLQKQIGKPGAGDAALEVLMKYYAALSAEVATKQLENIELQKSLLIKGDELYVQRPDLPQKKVSPKLNIVCAVAALASLALILFFIFIKNKILSISQNAEAATKISLIKSFLKI
jgi:capsular polysaccharide biosynthesis protein